MTTALSPRARRAAAMFGVPSAPSRAVHPALAGAHDVARALLERLTPRPSGRLVLLVGPSGSGKSTALTSLITEARRTRPVHVVDRPALDALATRTRPIVDCFRADLPVALRTLAAFGLADATLFPYSPSLLSDGQRWRLALAIAAERVDAGRARTPALVAIDEFAAVLDRPTAQSTAAGLRRWLNRLAAADCAAARAPDVVVATAHADLELALRPDIIIEFDLHTPPRIRFPGADTPASPTSLDLPHALRISPDAADDFRHLSRFHYRTSRPAAFVHILRAHDADAPLDAPPIGVLAVSMPTLNGRWRDLAWPGRYAGPDRRCAARRLNRELRCISRVIVDPRRRGCGVATALVRAYLHAPLTPATEAVAAMAACCPFFRRAGMTEYALAPSPRDARLADAIAAAGLAGRDPDDPAVRRLLTSGTRRARFIARELRHWADASRATRALLDAPVDQIARVAWSALAAPIVAYAAAAE
jgi:GNAT superfamily N-acetyltransferase